MKTAIDYFIQDVFKKSKKQIGNIYLCDVLHRFMNTRTNEIFEEHLYKYGKTKNIIKRMQMYSKPYKLIKTWNVNHLSLREYLIHNDWHIEEDRHENLKDSRDEHVNFNCEDIVNFYCNAEIILKKDRILILEDGIEAVSYPSQCILELLHF